MPEKKVYILFTDTGTLFTKMIKCYTKKPYNHASISFDAELFEVYSFGRKTARNPFNGGFVKENVRQGLFKQAECAIYSLSVSDEQYESMWQYIEKINKHKEKYRYNFLGLFGFLLKKPIHRKYKFFCSQFVASVLKECAIIDFEKSPALMTPYDLQSISTLQLVYEGKLKDYLDQDIYENERVSFRFIPIKL